MTVADSLVVEVAISVVCGCTYVHIVHVFQGHYELVFPSFLYCLPCMYLCFVITTDDFNLQLVRTWWTML